MMSGGVSLRGQQSVLLLVLVLLRRFGDWNEVQIERIWKAALGHL